MFSGANAYSQQISAQMPPAYNYPQAPYGMQQVPGFNYGGGFYGHGPHNLFGNQMTAYTGGAASMALATAPVMAGFMGGAAGTIGRIADPVSWAMGGYRLGQGLGFGMLGAGAVGVGAAMLPAAGLMFGQHIINAGMHGAQAQSDVERILNSYNFINSSSRSGMGFSRAGMSGIHHLVETMSRMPEMLTSVGELHRIMEKVGQMGLMQGVKDAGDFQKKFTQTIHTLRDMAGMMGTTMEGALKAFDEARRSGMYSTVDILRNTMNRQITSSMTGMTQQQVGALQQYGAELSHSMGGSRRGGNLAITRQASQIGMLNRMGIISNDQITEMTGKEGAEGIQDLSASLSQLGQRMARSAPGTVLAMALGKTDADGRYTYETDEDLARRVRSGTISFRELLSIAHKKTATHAGKLSFATHRDRLTTEMANSTGAEGQALLLQHILGKRGWSNPDATNLVMQRFGASEEEANLLQEMLPNLQLAGSQGSLLSRQAMRQTAKQMAYRENYSIDAVKRRISTKIAHYTTNWARDLGSAVKDAWQDFADDFVDDLTGQYRTHVTAKALNNYKSILASGGNTLAALRSASGGSLGFGGHMGVHAGRGGATAIGLMAGVISGGTLAGLSAGAFLGATADHNEGMGGLLYGYGDLAQRAYHSVGEIFGASKPRGEQIADLLQGLDGGKYLTTNGARFRHGGTAEEAQRAGFEVLDESVTGHYRAISQSGYRAALNRMKDLSGAGGMAENLALQSSMGSGYDKLRQDAASVANMGSIMLISDPQKRAEAISKELSKRNSSWSSIVRRKGSTTALLSLLGDPSLQKYSAFSDLGSKLLGNIDISDTVGINRKREHLDQDLATKLKGEDGSMAWAQLKSLIESGGGVSKILSGNGKVKGLLQGNSALRDELASGRFSDSGKKMLRDAGLTDSEINDLEGNQDLKAQLIQASQSGNAGEVSQYIKISDLAANSEIYKQITGRGKSIVSSLTGASSHNKAVQSLISNVLTQAGALGRGDKDMDYAGLGRQLHSLDSKSRAEAEEILRDRGAEEVSIAGHYEDSILGQHLGKGKKSVKSVLKKAGITARDSDLKLILSKFGSDTVDSGDLQKLADTVANVKGGSASLHAGDSANSSQVTEKDVATALSKMGDNAGLTAQILANIAAGQPPNQGLAKPTKAGKL